MFVGHKTTEGRGHEYGGIVFILYTLSSVGESVGVRGPAGVYSLFPSRGGGGGAGLWRSEDSLPDSQGSDMSENSLTHCAISPA